MFTPKDSEDYYKAQGAFFTACVLTILGSLTLLRIDKSFFDFLPRLHQGLSALSQFELNNILWVINTVIAFAGLLFVDVSFFHNGGMRISAVVGIAFVNVVWHLIRGK